MDSEERTERATIKVLYASETGLTIILENNGETPTPVSSLICAAEGEIEIDKINFLIADVDRPDCKATFAIPFEEFPFTATFTEERFPFSECSRIRVELSITDTSSTIHALSGIWDVEINGDPGALVGSAVNITLSEDDEDEIDRIAAELGGRVKADETEPVARIPRPLFDDSGPGPRAESGWRTIVRTGIKIACGAIVMAGIFFIIMNMPSDEKYQQAIEAADRAQQGAEVARNEAVNSAQSATSKATKAENSAGKAQAAEKKALEHKTSANRLMMGAQSAAQRAEDSVTKTEETVVKILAAKDTIVEARDNVLDYGAEFVKEITKLRDEAASYMDSAATSAKQAQETVGALSGRLEQVARLESQVLMMMVGDIRLRAPESEIAKMKPEELTELLNNGKLDIEPKIQEAWAELPPAVDLSKQVGELDSQLDYIQGDVRGFRKDMPVVKEALRAIADDKPKIPTRGLSKEAKNKLREFVQQLD